MEKFEIYSLVGIFLTIGLLVGSNFYFISKMTIEPADNEDCDFDLIDRPLLDIEDLLEYLTFKSEVKLIAEEINATWDAETIIINRVGVKFSEFNSSKYTNLINYLDTLAIWFLNQTGDSEIGDYEDIELDITNILNNTYRGNSFEVWTGVGANNSIILGGVNPITYIIDEINYRNNSDIISDWHTSNYSYNFSEGINIHYNHSLSLENELLVDLFDLITDHITVHSVLSQNGTIAQYISDTLIGGINVLIAPLLVQIGAGLKVDLKVKNIAAVEIESSYIPKVTFEKNSVPIIIDAYLNLN